MKPTTPTDDAPPPGLSPRGVAFWAELRPRCRSAGRRMLLEHLCRALDRAERCRALVEAEGLVAATRTTGVRRLHPALRAEQESTLAAIKLAKILGLNWDPRIDARVD